MKSSWMKVFHKGQQFPKVLWDGCKISHIFISGHDPFCFLLKYSTRLVHSQHGRPLENQRVVLCVRVILFIPEEQAEHCHGRRRSAAEGTLSPRWPGRTFGYWTGASVHMERLEKDGAVP